MKRALAFAVVALFVGITGFAQISGTWAGKIQLLSSVNFIYTKLTLKYTIAGFELTSASTFGSTGFSDQTFSISGTVGAADISGEISFNPTGPAYSYAWLSSSLSFGGVDITSEVFHGAYSSATSDAFSDKYDKGNLKIYSPPYYYTFEGVYEEACQTTPEDGDVLMFYTLGISADPLSVTAHFADCCTGIEFYDLDISLSDLSLCCGITYDLEVYFNKEGFQFADFYIGHLFDLCCGLSFGVDVTFSVDKKEVSPIVKWNGIEGCVTVWGKPWWDSDHNAISALDIWGWKIYCEFSECNKLEIVTALDTSKFWNVGGKLVVSSSEPAYASPYFEDGESEYIKIETCGAGCCGGNWSLSAQTFFATNTTGGLFGITRTKVSASVPVMSNLSISLSMELPYSGEASLYLGWSFSF